MNFDKTDLRKLIYFLWKDDLNPPAIQKKINSVLGEDTISLSTCQRWVSRFNHGNFELTDAERTGRPSASLEDQIIELLECDKYETTRTMAEKLDVSHETVRSNLIKMGKKHLMNTWVPYRLTDANKDLRMEVCEELLAMYHQNDFLMRLITVDECWIYWQNDEKSYHNRAWVTPGGDGTTSVRSKLTNKNTWHLCSGIVEAYN